ncbi:Terpene synthase [Theobroma cacao]|nr:Terpene synthase [Theobroma cacao]
MSAYGLCPVQNRVNPTFSPVSLPAGNWASMLETYPGNQRVAYHFGKEIEDALETIYRDCNSDRNDLCITSLPFRLPRQHGFNVHCGVAYHFEKEIDDALETIYNDSNVERDDDLYITAVRFRLLREHGFNVHCDLFNKFKDEKGNFKASLISDVRGLLELYEAAHLRVHGENILEEALAFTTIHLKSAETMVEYPLSTQITNALKRPLRKSLPRLVARSSISMYEGYGKQDDNLLQFAKLDFKLLQHLHKNEIITSFVGMDDTITKETFVWAFHDPKILRASTIIFEQERGHVASAVECYMKQYEVPEQQAYKEFDKQIKNAWKDINEEFFMPTVVPEQALDRILNLTRVLDLFYKDEDAYTNVGEAAKTSITSLLIDPIPI